MNSEIKSTKSLQEDKATLVEQGRAIARGISEENARKERNMAIAAKRKQTMLENAAKDVFRDY